MLSDDLVNLQSRLMAKGRAALDEAGDAEPVVVLTFAEFLELSRCVADVATIAILLERRPVPAAARPIANEPDVIDLDAVRARRAAKQLRAAELPGGGDAA